VPSTAPLTAIAEGAPINGGRIEIEAESFSLREAIEIRR
jgi:hypothetical protein